MNDERMTNPLRVSRLRRGMTQEELATRAGIAASTLRRLESGDPVAADMATKIAKVLDASPDERLAWREYAVACRAERLVRGVEPVRLAAVLAARKVAAASEVVPVTSEAAPVVAPVDAAAQGEPPKLEN